MSLLSRPIVLFNPALRDRSRNPSNNLGDLIIERAVTRELKRIYSDQPVRSIPSHDYPELRDLAQCWRAKERFFGGTNVLTGRLQSYYQLWKVAPWQRPFIRDVTLLAAGWMYYEPEEAPEADSVAFWRGALSRRRLHSVRDQYSKIRLQNLGIENVVNTSCVTLWPFLEADAPKIPETKADSCLMMLTDWLPDLEADRKLIEFIESSYRKVWFWPQGKGDEKLYHELGGKGELIRGGLAGLDRLLNSQEPFDYIGSRLHGGIYCQLHERRGLILSVDNRATEIGRDTDLPVVDRGDLKAVQDWVESPRKFKLRLPADAIREWRNQFQSAYHQVA